MLQNLGRTQNPWRLLDEMLGTTGRDLGSVASAANSVFPIDVVEHDNQIVVTMDLPGAAPDSIDARLEGNVLTISAQLATENAGNQRYLWRERPSGQVRRAITLPVRLDPDGTEASFNNGVLTVTLRKAPEATARRIAVNASNEPKAITG